MLTDQSIRRLRPRAADYWRADSNQDGTTNNLYLRVRASGRKTWHVRRLKDGVLLNRRIGEYPDMGLRQARTTAQDIIAGVVDGTATLKAVGDEWFRQRIEGRYKRPKQIRQYLDRIAPTLLIRPIHDLTRREITAELQRYAKDRGPVGANRLLAILKQLFAYAHKVGYLPDSELAPLTRDEIGGQEKPRERVLTDDEIRLAWRAESDHAPLLRFLLLTAQRIGEAQKARWDHLDLEAGRWTIPAANSKNGKAHWVALSPAAVKVLEALPREEGRALVFGRASDTAVQAWLRRWCERQKIAPAFRPHDLRRTAATRMNDLGVAPHVVEKILNHSMQGVMAVYNKAEYADERTAAMQTWADELGRMVSGGAA
jgi:integrase